MELPSLIGSLSLIDEHQPGSRQASAQVQIIALVA